MSKSSFRKTLLSGVAAIAIIAGASNISPANADGPWQGFYFGVDAGFGGADFDGINNGPGTHTSAAFGSDIDGFIGGFHVGYNHQINSFVIGVEADMMFPNWEEYQPGRNLTPGSASVTGITDSVDLLATIRARLGYVPRDDVMIYATGGVAFIEAEHRIWGSAGTDFADFDLNDVGFVVGGGVEWRPDDWYTLRAQGLYYGFDEKKNTSGVPGFGGTTDTGDFGELNGTYSFMVGISFNLEQVWDKFHGN